MEEKISVIVPVYRTEKYLDRCISSIVNQTYSNLEIILVDDGSPDNCPKMCDKWAEVDTRIKVIHKKNEGVAAARQTGIEMSTGDYITFVDSDDWLKSDMLECLYSLIKGGDYQISSCGYNLSYGETDFASDSEKAVIKSLSFDLAMKNLSTDSLWSIWGKLFEKSLFNELPEIDNNYSVSEDLLLNYFLFKNAKKIVVTNEKKYIYFRHSDSVMGIPLNKDRIEHSTAVYRIIRDDIDKSSDAYTYHMANIASNDMMFLKEIICQNICREYYKPLRKEIFDCRKYIFSNKNRQAFPTKKRIAVLILFVCPKAYNLMIKLRKKAE